MSNRELFHATMRRENGTRLLHMEQGFNVVHPDWRKQGLPKEVQTSCNVKLTTTTNLYDYMNVSGYLYCHFNQFCIPEFEEVTLEQNETRRIYRNRQGVTLMERTERRSTMNCIESSDPWSGVGDTSHLLTTWRSGARPLMATDTTASN